MRNRGQFNFSIFFNTLAVCILFWYKGPIDANTIGQCHRSLGLYWKMKYSKDTPLRISPNHPMSYIISHLLILPDLRKIILPEENHSTWGKSFYHGNSSSFQVKDFILRNSFSYRFVVISTQFKSVMYIKLIWTWIRRLITGGNYLPMKQELYLFTYLYQAQSIKSLQRYTNEIPAPEAQYVS